MALKLKRPSGPKSPRTSRTTSASASALEPPTSAEPVRVKDHPFLRLSAKRGFGVSRYSPETLLSRVTQWVPTGIEKLDDMLGGGIPVGRITEVFGGEGVGKSALSHILVTNLHNMDANSEVLLLETETALDDVRVQSYVLRGLDTNRILYAPPEHIERVFDIISSYLADRMERKVTSPCLIIWDSLAATPSKEEVERTTQESKRVGAQARAISDGLRAITNRLPRANAALLVINQTRVKIGGYAPMGMIPEDTPGGRAPKYYCTLRLKMRRGENIPKTGRQLGMVVKIKTVKNKLVPQNREESVVLDFACGISRESTLFYDLLSARRIRPHGKGLFALSWKRDKTFTREQFVQMCQKPEFFDKCHAKLKSATEGSAEEEAATDE